MGQKKRHPDRLRSPIRMPESCRDGLDRWHEVGGRLIRERHDGDVGERRCLDDAAFDEAAEVDHDGCGRELGDPVADGLPRLQGHDAAFGERGLVDVGGAVVEVVGDQDSAAVLRSRRRASTYPALI